MLDMRPVFSCCRGCQYPFRSCGSGTQEAPSHIVPHCKTLELLRTAQSAVTAVQNFALCTALAQLEQEAGHPHHSLVNSGLAAVSSLNTFGHGVQHGCSTAQMFRGVSSRTVNLMNLCTFRLCARTEKRSSSNP